MSNNDYYIPFCPNCKNQLEVKGQVTDNIQDFYEWRTTCKCGCSTIEQFRYDFLCFAQYEKNDVTFFVEIVYKDELYIQQIYVTSTFSEKNLDSQFKIFDLNSHDMVNKLIKLKNIL